MHKTYTNIDEDGMAYSIWQLKNKLSHMNKYIFLFLLTISFTTSVKAQNFKSKIIVGSNFCQITGDSMAGFNKVGLIAGAGLSLALSKKTNICFEIAYSRKGAHSSADTLGTQPIRDISLTYIDIPVYIQYEAFPRISIEGGFVYGIMNKATYGDGNQVYDQTESYRKDDLETLIGVQYRFFDQLAFNARLMNSVLGISKTNYLLNVVTSLTMRYTF